MPQTPRTIARKFLEKRKDKKNPNSIRRLFFDLVDQEFRGNQKFAAYSLTKFADTQLEGDTTNYRRLPITREILNRINQDAVYIQYWHLELIARYLKLPLGIILLFTRMQSNVDKKDGDLENQRISRFLRNISDELDKSDNAIDYAMLKKWSKIYEGSSVD